MSEQKQERWDEDRLDWLEQKCAQYAGIMSDETTQSQSLAGLALRAIRQLRGELENCTKRIFELGPELARYKTQLAAAQQILEMHRIQDESGQPCAECEAYYALQARIDGAPEYWAVRAAAGGYTTIFDPVEMAAISQSKDFQAKGGWSRFVRVRLVEIPDEQEEPAK